MAKGANGTAGALEQSASHLLHRALQRALDIYAEISGPEALTQRQYVVLAAVSASEGVTQTALVKATGIDRSTLADLVGRMIDKGLLARERSSVDARANAVRLTEQGREALTAAAPQVHAVDQAILALLPRRRRDQFLEALERVGSGDARDKAARKLAKAEKKIARKARKLEKKAAETPSEPSPID